MDEGNTPKPVPSATITPAAKPQTPPATPAPEAPKKGTPLLVPVIVLLVLALFAGGYFLYANRTVPPPPSEVTESEMGDTEPLFLSLTSPAGEVTSVNGEILVAGRTLPGATVVIFTDTDETSLESDTGGNFESTVVVGNKGGLVRVTAYGDAGEEETVTLNVLAEEP